MAGTELEELGVYEISLRHMKLHCAPMLATQGPGTLLAASRAVSSLQKAPHEVGSYMSDLLAPLFRASALCKPTLWLSQEDLLF